MDAANGISPPSGAQKEAKKPATAPGSLGGRPVRSSKHPNKVRVKLPPIESYEKEVSFRAEGPGRVVVRLERLMGSDRIKLTDPKFMSTLLERLEEEEHVSWVKRTKDRKKTEKNRSRQLAIEGLMEPTEDMQDLYAHPVFRVNRVLKRLSQFDQTMTQGQEIHLPPITPIDPFAIDDTGGIFRDFPGHTFHGDLVDDRPPAYIDVELRDALSSKDFIPVYKRKEDEEDGEERIGEEEGEDNAPSKDNIEFPNTLAAVQGRYGIGPEENLTAWEPFRSNLVELVYDNKDTEKSDELYELAGEVLGVYKREAYSVDRFMKRPQKYQKE